MKRAQARLKEFTKSTEENQTQNDLGKLEYSLQWTWWQLKEGVKCGMWVKEPALQLHDGGQPDTAADHREESRDILELSTNPKQDKIPTKANAVLQATLKKLRT